MLRYKVILEKYAEQHYIKSFSKDYKSTWSKTMDNIVTLCEHIDNVLHYKRASIVKQTTEYKLVKLNFAIEGTKKSPKASGNRCILFVNESEHSVKILLVYHKNHVKSKHETAWWQGIIADEFPDIRDTFN
jgi:hypothetical protein